MMFSMKLQEIEQEALGLSEGERAELVLSLMRHTGGAWGGCHRRGSVPTRRGVGGGERGADAA